MSYVEKINALSEQIKTHYARLFNFEEASAKNTWETISDLFTENFQHLESKTCKKPTKKEIEEEKETPAEIPEESESKKVEVNAKEQLDLVRQIEAEGRVPLDKVACKINMDRINEGKSAIPFTYYNQKAGKIRKAKLNNNEDFGKKFGSVYYYSLDELEEIREEVSKYGESAHD